MAEERKFDTASYDAAQVRRQAASQAPQQRRPAGKAKKKKVRRKRTALYLACVFVVSCLLAVIGWLLCNDLCALNKDYKEVKFVVEEGDDFADVTKNLKKEGLIEYKFLFKMVGPVFHAKGFIDPGEYDLNTDMDYRSLIWSMHDYEADQLEAAGLVRITVPEGLTVDETIDLLVENGISTRAEWEEACANYEFEDYDFLDPDKLGDINRVEGFLIPDTHEFFKEKSAVAALDVMLFSFQNQISQEMLTAIEYSKYDLEEIITIASLIEKECGPNDDPADFASVIYNRLGVDMPLQLDSTINYINGTSTLNITNEDLEIESPYNTYLHTGLPVGPICSPGLSAIKAAIYPNETDYWYWYSYEGTTKFFTDFADQQAYAKAHPYSLDD